MQGKFAYIQHHGLPSHKAHSVYIVNVAEAASSFNNQTFLVVPSFNNQSNKQIKKYYKLEESKLNIIQINSLDIRQINWVPQFIKSHLWYLISAWTFSIMAARWLSKNNFPYVQTGDRELMLIKKYFKLKTKLIYDVHFDFSLNWYDNYMERASITAADRVIVNAHYLKQKFVGMGVKAKTIIILSNGYNPRLFNRISLENSRKKFKFPQEKFIIGFVGRFETRGIEKGIRELIQAVDIVKKKIPITLVAIGGPGHLVSEYEAIAQQIGLDKETVIIRDYISPDQIGDVIAGFDVCALLYPPIDYFTEKMSPMKAMEYQAAGKEIIATDMPSIRNILEDSAHYVSDFSPKEIACKIEQIYKNKDNKNNKKKQYKILSWIDRQKIIMEGL